MTENCWHKASSVSARRSNGKSSLALNFSCERTLSRDTDNDATGFDEFRIQIAELRGFGRTTGGAVLGIAEITVLPA